MARMASLDHGFDKPDELQWWSSLEVTEREIPFLANTTKLHLYYSGFVQQKQLKWKCKTNNNKYMFIPKFIVK